MSGQNTRASKIDRLLSRQIDMERKYNLDFAIMRLQREAQDNTVKLLTETAHRLEAENARLRKYLGSVLFERRKRDMQIPTLSTQEGK